MALATIDNLKSTLQVGSRPNLFKATITWPSGVAVAVDDAFSATDKTTTSELLCKSAALPSFTIGVIEVPVRGGRRIKIPGDRTFADWTVTFILDSAHKMRQSFLDWKEFISTSNYDADYIRKDTVGFNYDSDIIIEHLRQNGSVSRRYKLFDAFPTDVGAIDLSFDSTDTLSEFTVTFQYHYMQAIGGATDFSETTKDVTVSTVVVPQNKQTA